MVAPTGNTRKLAPNDVHRTLIDDGIRAKILKLALADEPVPIRIIAQRFGLSFKSVWQVVSEHMKSTERRGLGPDTNKISYAPKKKAKRSKRRLGLAFEGSQDFTR